MQIKLKGDMSIADLRQALFEKLHQIEEEFAVHFSRGATLFINPTNEIGEDVVPRNEMGQAVIKMSGNGPYRAAADEYKP